MKNTNKIYKKRNIVILIIICTVWFGIREYNIEKNVKTLNEEANISCLHSEKLSRNIVRVLCSPLYSHNLRMVLFGDVSEIWTNNPNIVISEYKDCSDKEIIRWFSKNKDGKLINISLNGKFGFVVDKETWKIKGQYYMK